VERFGTNYRFRDANGQLAGDKLPVDLAANAESLGANVLRVATIEELRDALVQARSATTTTVIRIETDPNVAAPDSASWWDVPVAQVVSRDSTREALAHYESERKVQRDYLTATTFPSHDADPA
jgi:3D-(3,5/4)-trihydroxycyclohexane-1,2-dione acylhydrolase (decyclizing)